MERNAKSRITSVFKMVQSSYFIHEITVVIIVLLISINCSFALQKVEQQSSDSVLRIQPGSNASNPLSTSAAKAGSPKTFPDDGSIPEQKTLFFGEDTNGVPVVTGTWFRYGSYTLAFCLFGTAFLVTCAASAIYYVVFVVTEPSQQRSAPPEEEWNFGRILRAIQLAYETYETFDPYSPACQLKSVCEIQEGGHFEGSLIKRIAHFMIHTDIVRKKLANAEQLRAADRIGNDPGEQCADKFQECQFSLNKIYDRYLTL